MIDRNDRICLYLYMYMYLHTYISERTMLLMYFIFKQLLVMSVDRASILKNTIIFCLILKAF